jgi:hypothetical protein
MLPMLYIQTSVTEYDPTGGGGSCGDVIRSTTNTHAQYGLESVQCDDQIVDGCIEVSHQEDIRAAVCEHRRWKEE